MLELRNINHHNKFFERVIISLILFYIPIILKVILNEKIKNEFILTCSPLLVFLYEYFQSFIFFLKIKIRNEEENQFKKYKKIAENYPELSPQLNEISKYVSNEKYFCKTSEFGLNFIYFIIKFFFYFFWVFNFKNIGAKLDQTVDVTWGILFIPVYIIEIPIVVYMVVYFLSKRKKKINKVLHGLCLFGIYIGFSISSILIPLKADGSEFNFFVIPGLNLFSTILIYLHRCLIALK